MKCPASSILLQQKVVMRSVKREADAGEQSDVVKGHRSGEAAAGVDPWREEESQSSNRAPSSRLTGASLFCRF